MNKIRQFECLIDETSLDDGGVASFTFTVKSLTKGTIYKEHQQWVGKNRFPSGYIIDDNSCWIRIDSSDFNKKFKEL